MRIIWSPEATEDLADLRDYIARDNPDAAQRVAARIFQTIERNLSENPELGHPGRVPDTRELVIPHTPVIIPYRLNDGTLQILGIHHHSRRWPDRF
jgi:toxin ParE1/3/4